MAETIQAAWEHARDAAELTSQNEARGVKWKKPEL